MRELVQRMLAAVTRKDRDKDFGVPQEFYKALSSAKTEVEGLEILKKLAEQAQSRVSDYKNDPLAALRYACEYVTIALKRRIITDPAKIEFWKSVIIRAQSATPESLSQKKLEE